MTLAWNRYGKSRVRLVKVAKRRPSHDLIDLTIDVQLEGGFAPVYNGDNALCVATDTMKNTVYAFARRFAIDHVEAFLSRLADHFVEKTAVTAARLTAVEQPWTRLSDHAFVQPGASTGLAS
jgi:urate oxidase